MDQTTNKNEDEKAYTFVQNKAGLVFAELGKWRPCKLALKEHFHGRVNRFSDLQKSKSVVYVIANYWSGLLLHDTIKN